MAVAMKDAYGLEVTTASRAAVDAYDLGVRALLGFGADPAESFVEALRHDPDFALAQAALGVSLYLDERIPEGRAAMERASGRPPGLSARERRHVEALGQWVAGRGNEAIPVMREHLGEYPRDMVVLQRLYFILFWQGRSVDILETTRAVLHAADGDSYLLGMHAFGLSENRRFDEALALARRAMAMNPKDAWAVHAMAHVHYERGDNARGVAELPPSIHPCDHLGYFRNHLLWHLALMRLAGGQWDQAVRLFENVFARIPITIASDLQDAVSLAWRLDLYGRPDPERWEPLGAAARRWLDLPLLLFHDLHVGMALAAASDWAAAESLAERTRQRAARTRNRTLPEVVVPMLEGLYAFARGEYARAVEAMAPVEDRIWEVGGSHAQREVFHDTLLAAALRAGQTDRAIPLLERRLAKRPNPGRYWEDTAAALRDAGRSGAAPA
jgi:tetratricopeptide (TPR) repeat protein